MRYISVLTPQLRTLAFLRRLAVLYSSLPMCPFLPRIKSFDYVVDFEEEEEMEWSDLPNSFEYAAKQEIGHTIYRYSTENRVGKSIHLAYCKKMCLTTPLMHSVSHSSPYINNKWRKKPLLTIQLFWWQRQSLQPTEGEFHLKRRLQPSCPQGSGIILNKASLRSKKTGKISVVYEKFSLFF